MTNLHRSPPMNQSKTDLGIVNESQFLRFGITGWRPPSFHETIGPVGAAGWPNPVPTFLVETSVRGFSASKAPFCEYRAQVERLKLGD
jgi:hypothetical protein